MTFRIWSLKVEQGGHGESSQAAIEGNKFDQVVRCAPFGALIQAFHGLVQHLLAENDAQLAV